MIPVPTSVRVWLATGYTDLRRGFPGLSLQIQEVLRRDPLSGQRMVRVPQHGLIFCLHKLVSCKIVAIHNIVATLTEEGVFWAGAQQWGSGCGRIVPVIIVCEELS